MASETTVSESPAYEYYQIKARFPSSESDPNDGINRKVFVRQDVDEWSSKKSNKKQVDLFILALDRFQKLDPKERLSYFQVAGTSNPMNRQSQYLTERSIRYSRSAICTMG